MKNKTWSARFSLANADELVLFNASLPFDKRLYKEDIKGSIAHANMLFEQGIIKKSDLTAIKKGLCEIEKEIQSDNFIFDLADEDIHMAIEQALGVKIGKEIAGRLHTARSRNDQVATDFKLFIRQGEQELKSKILELIKIIIALAKKHEDTIMPSFTHLQHAQSCSFAFYILSYAFMFQRDYKRLCNSYDLAAYSPLGACALAGTSYDTNRQKLALALGFKAPMSNAMDAVSDRDFALDFMYNISVFLMHTSRLCEDLIVYSSTEFGYISLSDAYSTGSSIMPQKKNPDSLELIRGKTGRCYGNLFALFTTLKALPQAYNKDMQEDKQGCFDSFDTALICLKVLSGVLASLQINEANMLKACKTGHLLATDLADYLVQKKNLPFRQAHFIVGGVVAKAEELGLDLCELKDLSSFDEHFGHDANSLLCFNNSINMKKSQGSTSKASVKAQIAELEAFIKGQDL